jgi:predicted RNA-binding protein YlqC (UPF0109 family)
MDAGIALKEFLEFVIGSLVRHRESAAVVHEVHGGRHVYRLRLAQEDMGRIIGRNGFTVSAIRSLLDAAARRHHIKATLRIDEDAKP